MDMFMIFNVNYDDLCVDDTLVVHKYLMKKQDIKLYLDLLKNVYCLNEVCQLQSIKMFQLVIKNVK